MRVLVTGATGLIGSRVVRALRAAGCTVTGASRQRPAGEQADAWCVLDFGSMTAAHDWLPLLQDGAFDAVVNCVGIIRAAAPGDFDRLHRAAPVALFAACEQLGLRVVQMSALGSDLGAATGYWRSKGAAEADLLARRLHFTIVRPSLVYGDNGASSMLFRMLATLPVLLLPLAHRALVQPVHVDDLAHVVVRLLTLPGAMPRELAVVGPRATTIAGYLGDLRRAMKAPAALVLSLPLAVARLTARLAALHPASAFTPESLHMLAASADGSNTANPAPAQALLGRPLRDAATFAQPAHHLAAVWAWAAPLVTVAFALMWLVTAYVSWFSWPHAESRSWLAACGVPAPLQEPLLLAASITDATIGVLLLLRPRRWLWAVQLALVGGYTVMLSVFLPYFWAHPFGPLLKNLPLLAVMALLWRLSPPKS